MFDNIKSKYIIKRIFSLLKETKKLKIINHNKDLQNKIEVNLIDYKIIFGKYIKYEKDGSAKEFNIINDKLLFEGEYLNGKRNGKGKEYDDGYLIFEGEYLNGKRTGKGKEYNGNGRLLYDGEYLNGERNGKGKEYYDGNNIRFDGEYLNGKQWNGKGYNIIYDKSLLKYGNLKIYELKDGKGYVKEYNLFYRFIYEGEYLNGKRHGKGTKYYDDETKFEGEFLNGKMWNGKRCTRKGRIIFELKNGNGEIKKHEYREYEIEGEYIKGKKYIKVKKYYDWDHKKNLEYEGDYSKGKKHGFGKEYNTEKELIFEGYYINDYKRKGKEYINGKLIFEGEYLFGKKWTGKGYDENKNVIYVLNNGNGTIKELDSFGNLIYDGEYLNGKRNGKGKQYRSDGKLLFDGEYLNGEKWNGEAKVYNLSGELLFGRKYVNGEIKK